MADHKAEMRARLLAAARTLFTTQGYTATTMQQIVQQAGTSIGNCYFYFPDKAAILLALFEEQMAHIGQVVDAALSELQPGVVRLAAAVYVGALATLAQPDIARIVLIEANHPDVRSRALAYFVARTRQTFEANAAVDPELDLALTAHLAGRYVSGVVCRVG